MSKLNNQRVKISLDKILKAFAEAFPQDYYSEGNQMEKLMKVLNNLARANRIQLPVGETHWDDSSVPSVPKWIKISRMSSQKERALWKKYPWHPQMIWASELKNIQESSFESLKQLNQFFVNLGGGSVGLMTIKERSLQIFGDEKKLDSLTTRSWFQDHVSLEDLGCYRTIEPFASKTFPKAKATRTIIIENRDTFDSFCKVNERINSPFYKYIIYGCGDKIEGRIRWVNEFDPEIRVIEYFGDLDHNGLAIPHRINQIFKDNNDPHRIKMAKVFYYRLVELAREQRPLFDNLPSSGKIHNYLFFLLPEDQKFVNFLLQQGQRIAQELLNYEEVYKSFQNLNK